MNEEKNEEKTEDRKQEMTEQITNPEKSPLPTRSYMLQVLAGIYLLWTGYRLCKNVLDGAEGGGIGFFLAGVAFLIIGAGVGFNGLRGVMVRDKLQKAAEQAAERVSREEAAAAEQSKEKTAAQPEKKMSIADRANLASSLGVAGEETEEPEEQNTEE